MSGFSLAFTGKKQQRRVEVQEKDEGAHKEAVIGFGDGGLQTAEPQQSSQGPLVIPKLENTYRTGAGKKFTPSYIPEAADQIDAGGIDKFETAEHDLAASKEAVAYGLQQRARPQANGAAAAAAQDGGGTAAAQSAEPANEAEVLKRDLAELPPEAPLEAYEAMPVDKFGEALLRGMGWQSGRAIGRGGKEEVVAKELVRRPQRLGLGATPAPETHQKKYIKPGESREKKDLVYVDGEGQVKSSKPVGEKLVERKKEGVHPGKVMRVVDGRHSGLLCEVISLEPKQEGRSDRDGGGSEPGDKKHRGGSVGAAGLPARGAEEDEGPPWLVPNIRVKVVDKRAAGGRLYLKKGVVVDVSQPTVCDVHFPDLRETVQHLRQSQLETVVPAAVGAPLLVLLGKLRGRRGRLLKRNTETGLAAVQLTSDMSVHKLSLDEVAECAGPAEDDDY